MSETLRALRYRNIDTARSAMKEAGIVSEVFDDNGAEPSGLLSVIPEDRLSEEDFYRLFGVSSGTLVQVEKIPFHGYGPPALEEYYMGYAAEGVCYVLEGNHLAVEIENCPQGAHDLHHLEALTLDQLHPLDRAHLARKLGLAADWEFEDLFDLIVEGRTTAQEIDRLLHMAVH